MICHGQGIVYYLKYQELLEYANPATDPPIAYAPPTKTSSAKFQINKGKLYVPVVTLSINDNIKFLENIKQGFKRTISWNKYRSEMKTQPNNNNLDYLGILIYCLFFNSLNVVSDPTRLSFDRYYISLIGINATIDNTPFSEIGI